MADVSTQEQAMPVLGMTAQGRFDSLTAGRSPFILRAQRASAYTIPGLFPPTGANGGTNYEAPFQSVGARGVNNLASKLLLALLPPGSSFFKLNLDDFIVAQLAKKYPDAKTQADARGAFDEALGRVERAVCAKLEKVGARTTVFETLKQLIVAGNGLLQILDDGKLQLHILHNYVVKRDASGNVLDIVVKQTLSRLSLPDNARAVVNEVESLTPRNDDNADSTLDLFTRISRVPKEGTDTEHWTVYQEICGKSIPGTDGTYPLDKSPWLPLRFTHIAGEDYGRGFVEEYQGDLTSLETLTEAIVRFSAVAAKIVFFADESGTTDKNKVARAKSGDVLDGAAKDITTLQLEKFNDFKIAKEVADDIQHRLEQAFLLDSAAQRDAERVTAEEIRLIANSLEMGLGGFYSILAEEFQRPLVSRFLFQMGRSNELPKLPRQAVNPSIVTGLEALGRNADLNKLDVLLEGAAQTFGPNVVAQYVNPGSYFTRRGAALGIDMTGLVRTDEQVQAQIAQDQQAAQAQAAVPNIVKGASDHAAIAAQAQQKPAQPAQQ